MSCAKYVRSILVPGLRTDVALEARREALEQVARAWNTNCIRYGVAHGLAEYPQVVGRDLDVVVERQQVAHALSTATQVLRHAHWKTALPPKLYGDRLVAFRNGEALEIHLLERISWKGVALATSVRPGMSLGPFKIDPWASFTKRVLLPLLAGDYGRFRRDDSKLALMDAERAVAQSKLPTLIPDQLAAEIIRCAVRRDLAALVRLTPRVRRSLLIRAASQAPFTTATGLLKLIQRKLQAPFSPCSPVVAVVGPDGVGKSTLLEALKNRQQHIFTDVEVRHWRPGILPPLAALMRQRSNHPSRLGPIPPRRTPGRGYWLRLLYYASDFLLGYYLKDRIDSSRQKLLLYDRCFLDMLVDPARYGMSSTRGMYLAWRLLPKPDLILLLHDEPKRIYQRKPEIPVSEIQRQFAEWQKLVDTADVHEVLQVDLPSEDLVRRVVNLIADAFVSVNQVKRVF